MFIVTIENDGIVTEIHNDRDKLTSGKVVKGINSIDTFSFSMLPSNPGFKEINDFTTLVKVYNTNKNRYEFYGRVLYSDTTMDESGLITKDVTCESYFGFFCDSQQPVVGVKNWTVLGLLRHIISKHNEQLEEYKRFTIGEVTVTDPNDNLYLGIQYANTWDTLKEKLIDKLGGEFRFRVVDGVNYLDYLTEIGKTSTTEIALSRNMKSIKQEKDPSAYVTRLIPLGMKVGENDERLTIAEVNGGKDYIDDAYGIEKYGIHVAYHEWDDVTDERNLLRKGKAWLEENNRLQIKYSITALDLSLLSLDVDDFEVCDYYPIKNALLGIDDVARIIKKTIDVCEEVKSTIEVGDNFKALSDIQISQAAETAKAYSQIVKTAEEIRLEVAKEIEGVESNVSQIQQQVDGITLTVTNSGTSSTIALKSDGVVISSQKITFNGLATYESLANGTTEIDGGCIKAGSSIESPDIAGGKFLDLERSTWLEMATPNNSVAYLHQYASLYSDSEPVCAMGYYSNGATDEWVIAPFNNIRIGYSNTYDLMYLMGKWDISQAEFTGTLSSDGDIALSAGSGTVAMRLDESEDRINISVGGKVWYIDSSGFHD